jgi:hypothetical protein
VIQITNNVLEPASYMRRNQGENHRWSIYFRVNPLPKPHQKMCMRGYTNFCEIWTSQFGVRRGVCRHGYTIAEKGDFPESNWALLN